MIPISVRHALVVTALAALCAGCGLAAEIDREVDPARTGAQALPRPSSTDAPDDAGPTPGPRAATPEAATTAEACPATGWRVTTGAVNAAMGLRAMPVTVTHCARDLLRLNGYPDVRVRDVAREPMDVTVLKGPEPITRLDDPGPHPVALAPGESARSVFVWRYSAVDAATRRGSGVYVEIAPAAGAPRQTVEPEGGLDVGETGLLGTTAWSKVLDD
jgi:hypothetical protein